MVIKIIYEKYSIYKLRIFFIFMIILCLTSCDYQRGYKAGYKEGHKDGYRSGYFDGTKDFVMENGLPFLGTIILFFIGMICMYFLWRTYKSVFQEKIYSISDEIKEKIARRKILSELEELKNSEVFKAKIDKQRELKEYKNMLDYEFAELLNKQDIELALNDAFKRAYSRSEHLAEDRYDIYINLLTEVSHVDISAKHKREIYQSILFNAKNEEKDTLLEIERHE